jgi:hypothetical protein
VDHFLVAVADLWVVIQLKIQNTPGLPTIRPEKLRETSASP